MSDFLKYLGMDEEDEALARKLVSPADMAAQGASSLGESAGRVLSGLGAKLDARLGTTGYRVDEDSPDVFRTMPEDHERSPGAPLDRRGLFETLGHAVPNIAAVVGGNALPMAGPAMPGAVAAFPSPKQSLARMKEEAVFRDAMEAKGATPLPRMHADMALANKAYEAGLEGVDDVAPQVTQRIRGAEDANDFMRGGAPRNSSGGGTTLTGIPEDEWRHILKGEDVLDPKWLKKIGAPAPTGSFPNPRARVSAEQSELERYLAGLYGPKASK